MSPLNSYVEVLTPSTLELVFKKVIELKWGCYSGVLMQWLVSLKEKEDTRGEMITWIGNKVTIHKPRTEASEETRPASTLILDF